MFRFILATTFLTSFILGITFISLPIAVSICGFWPGLVATLLIWLFSIATSLLYLEATLACPKGANLMTISKMLGGPLIKWGGSAIFCYANLAFLVSYYLLLDPFLSAFSEPFLGYFPPLLVSGIILTLVIGVILFLGRAYTFFTNFVLFIVFAVIFCFIFYSGVEHVSPLILNQRSWTSLIFSLPFLNNAFFFQTVIPTLAAFLHYDQKKTTGVLLLGLTLAMILIILWLWITVGSVIGDNIMIAFQGNKSIIVSFFELAYLPFIGKWMLVFIFFSVLSSFFVVGLIFIDFFSDVFHVPFDQKRGWKRFLICCLVLIPSLILGQFEEAGVLRFLHTNFGFINLILSAIIPLFWVWSARYTLKLKKPLLFGGRTMLAILSIITAFLIYIEGVLIVQRVSW